MRWVSLWISATMAAITALLVSIGIAAIYHHMTPFQIIHILTANN